MGLFDEQNITEIINSIKNSEELKKYECNDIISSISLPITFNLRQLSIWLSLLEKFSFIKRGNFRTMLGINRLVGTQ